MERAALLQNLGFVPGDRNCVQETIDRLGLLPADPGTGCRTSVEVLLKDERYYFQLSSPNCRLVASPIDCNGDPVCDAGDADCLADFYRNAETGQTIGFLPE